MKSYVVLPALAAAALAAPAEHAEKRATPHVYLAGDSTMALGGGGTGTQGTSSLLSSHVRTDQLQAGVSIFPTL